MVRFLKQFLSSEKGQALPIVLAVLAVGGLTMLPGLKYATTVLNSSRMLDDRVRGIYAAGAGVEQVMWWLGHGPSPIGTTNLTENINQMSVNISTVNKGTYTLYSGGLIIPRDHYYYLNVSGNISWVGGNRYRYEIQVRSTENQNIFVEMVGARLPVDLHYEANSLTRSDGKNVHEPKSPITKDGQGADLLNWLWKDWGPPDMRPEFINAGDTYTQTFYITGTGSPEGNYAWVEGQPDVIGIVGEFTGTWYTITAAARRPTDNRTATRIVADVMKQGGAINILSWQISN